MYTMTFGDTESENHGVVIRNIGSHSVYNFDSIILTVYNFNREIDGCILISLVRLMGRTEVMLR